MDTSTSEGGARNSGNAGYGGSGEFAWDDAGSEDAVLVLVHRGECMISQWETSSLRLTAAFSLTGVWRDVKADLTSGSTLTVMMLLHCDLRVHSCQCIFTLASLLTSSGLEFQSRIVGIAHNSAHSLSFCSVGNSLISHCERRSGQMMVWRQRTQFSTGTLSVRLLSVSSHPKRAHTEPHLKQRATTELTYVWALLWVNGKIHTRSCQNGEYLLKHSRFILNMDSYRLLKGN